MKNIIKFLDLHEQYLTIKDEIDGAIASVINDSAFIGGKYVEQFEENFAEYQQVKYCIGVGNGTDALEIHTDSVRPGDRVLVADDLLATGGTVAACCELLEQCGAEVIGCSFLIDLTFLGGAERIAPHRVTSVIRY